MVHAMWARFLTILVITEYNHICSKSMGMCVFIAIHLEMAPKFCLEDSSLSWHAPQLILSTSYPQ